MLEHTALAPAVLHHTSQPCPTSGPHFCAQTECWDKSYRRGTHCTPHHQLSCPLCCQLCPAVLPACCPQGLPADGSPSHCSSVSTWVGSCFASPVLQHCCVTPQGSPPEGLWDDSAAPAEPTHSTSLCHSIFGLLQQH